MAKQLNVSLSVNADISQAKAQLQQLQQSLQNLKTTPITLGSNLDLSKTIGQIGQLQQHLQQATNTETGVLNFTKLNSSIKASGTSLQDYGKTLLSLGPQGRDVFNQLATSVSKAQIPVLSLNSTFSQLWTTMKNTMRWQLSSSAFHAVLGTMQSAWNYAQNLNESLTNIQIVTKQSDDQMIKFAESANKAAQSLSTTTTAYTNAALIYYQQGLNDRQVKERTDVTIKMANVTGQSAQQVSDQMTAIWNNFADGSHTMEYYADVITALGAATASSSEEISKGLEKFAAIADTVGLSYENATAALATITATTRQSADTVGTGLRTLFSRLQGLSLGETLEDGVNLTKYSKALATVGVQALDSEGNLRRMDDVLADLGEKWQNLSKAQQTALAQTVGGVRQYTTLMALMNNNDFFKQNQLVARNSTGELQAQEAIYEKSWKAAQKRLRASAESIYSDIIDDKFFITMSDGLSGLLKTIDKFIDGLGGIKGLIFSIISAVTTLNKAGSTKFFNSIIDNMRSLTPQGRAKLYEQQQNEIAGFQAQLRAQQEYASPATTAQINSMGYNLTAQSNYLQYRNGYNELQDLQAQSLLSNLEAVNGALIKTAQNFEALQGQTSEVRAAFTRLVGQEASQSFFYNNPQLNDYIKFRGDLAAYGIIPGEAGFIKEGDLSARISQVKAMSQRIGSISDTGLSNAFSQLLNSTTVNDWNAAILNVDLALGSLSDSLNRAAIAAAGEEASEGRQREASNRAAAAIEHEIRVRENNTRMQELDAQGKKLSGKDIFRDIPNGAAQKPTIGQYITEGMSVMSSAAMGLSMLKGTFGQISAAANGSGSWGDALLSTGTTLPFAAMMFKNAGKSFGESKLLNLAFSKTAEGKKIYQNASDAYLAKVGGKAADAYRKAQPTGLTGNLLSDVENKAMLTAQAATKTPEAIKGASAAGKAAVSSTGAEMGLAQLGPVLGAAAPYIAAIAAIGASIWMASELIVTSKERFDQLNKQLEQNKQKVTEVTEKYDTLNNSFSRQNELEEQIKNSKMGSIERNTAILQANQNAQQIITDNNLTSEDYSIKDGRIVLNEGVEQRLQEQGLEKIKQANQDVLDSQAAVATQQAKMDYEEALKIQEYNSETGITTYNQGWANRWAQEHSEYGYTSGEEVIKALQSGQLRNEMELSGGAAQKRRLALEQQILDRQGEITDDEAIIVNRMAQDQQLYDNIDKEVSINTSGGAAFLSALEFWNTDKSSGNMTLGELTRYAQSNYKEEYKSLIESDEYKNAERKEKRQMLANLVETNERQKKIDEKFKENQQSLEKFQDTYGKGTAILGQSTEQLFGENGVFADLVSGNITDENQKAIAQEYLNQYQEAQSNYVEMGAKLGLDMSNAYGQYSADVAQKIVDTTKTFQSSFGNEFAKNIFEQLKENPNDTLGGLTELGLTGNTISDLKTLKDSGLKDALTGNTYFKEAKASLGGEKGIFEALYNSEGFTESLASLQEIFKKTGEISAENILKASEGCEDLSNYLEITDVNAQGLADALESIELGDISGIDQLSEGLLRALSIAGELRASLAETYQHIDNFDAGRSANDILKFNQDLAKNITGSFDTGLFFDEPLLKSWEELFGESGREAYVQAVQEYASQGLSKSEIQAAMREKFADEFTLFEELSNAEDMVDTFDYALKKVGENSKYKDIFKMEDGDLFVNEENLTQLIDSYDNLNDLYTNMAEEMGISENLAQEMIMHMAQSSPSIKQSIEKNNLNRALKEGLFQNGEVVNAQGARAFLNQYQDVIKGMTQGEFAKILDIDTANLEGFNATAKMTSEIGLEMLRRQAEDTGATMIDLGKDFDYTNSSFKDLQDAWNKNKNKGNLKDYFTPTGDRWQNDDIYDIDNLLKQYSQLGITGSTAYKMIDDQMKEYHGQLEKTVTLLDGQTKTIRNTKGLSSTDFMADVDRQIQQANYDYLAEQLATKIGEITVNFTGEPQQLQNLINTKTYTAKVALTPQISGLQSAIEAAVSAAMATYRAAGQNNASFAGGYHSNSDYEGPAIVGELGPEAWVHNDQVELVGQHGREMIYVHANDQIFTAAQTREMPGFDGGKNWHGTGEGKSKKSNATSGNKKDSKWEPERYHLITRQLKDLQREYDRLSKIKDNAYGTNKLEAIQREIDATDELIKGQKALIKETEDYLAIDVERLRGLLAPGEFQIDENGNLLNFEELQQKYRKAAEQEKDEGAQDIWKALNQYEETLDKLQEANVEMQDLLYQEMELRLEKITTKVEMRIDFDDREIKTLDFYIQRIDDNIYHTAEVLALTEQKLGLINRKLEDTRVGIESIFSELSDSEGNKITKADGTNYTLEDWLALSAEERDMLDINDNFGKQLEEYMDDLLEYIEELEEFKTKGVEEFGEAFSELNDNVRTSIDLFDHYNQLLSSLKNITDLQGIKMTAEMKAARKEIDAIMYQNTQRNIQAEGDNYKRLVGEVEDLRKKIANTSDETLKRAWEEQLKVAEDELRTSGQNMLSLWETGLQQAKDIFEQALQDAVDSYEEGIAGMYGTTDELQKAWDQQKKNDEFYVKDYERYYQISKLQRSITKDLDAAARSGNKQNQGLKKLYDELNAARENGVQLSAYDLDIYAKRYEYEKALMELEDARNNKSEVRLQRDANGNWGYVYTSAADEDDLIAKQQEVDDKFYELQKATQERVASISDEMMQEISGVGTRLQELRSTGASQETIDKYLEQEQLYLDNYRKGLAKALADAGMTEEEARTRYGNAGFDILDDFQETLFSAITGGDEGLDEFFDRVLGSIHAADGQMSQATRDYQTSMDGINKFFNESGEDLAKVIKGFASVIGEESEGSLLDSEKQIKDAKDTFDKILGVARDFEREFMTTYQPVIDYWLDIYEKILDALRDLNREEFEGPGHSGGSSIKEKVDQLAGGSGGSEGGGSGSGGSGSKGSGREGTGGETTPPGETTPTGFSHYEYEYLPGRASHQVWAVYTNNSKVKVWVEQCSQKDDLGIEGNCKKIGCGKCKHVYSKEYPPAPFASWDRYYEYIKYNPQTAKPSEKSNFDTGGYTGSWGFEGRMAMLHEKELVLNKDDTKNFLDATNILRTIDLQTNLFSRGLGNSLIPWIDDMKQGTLDQNVHIEASFPNVQNHDEIEMAFDNLINKASQYANRKNMSSMTFQDMYTTKF